MDRRVQGVDQLFSRGSECSTVHAYMTFRGCLGVPSRPNPQPSNKKPRAEGGGCHHTGTPSQSILGLAPAEKERATTSHSSPTPSPDLPFPSICSLSLAWRASWGREAKDKRRGKGWITVKFGAQLQEQDLGLLRVMLRIFRETVNLLLPSTNIGVEEWRREIPEAQWLSSRWLSSARRVARDTLRGWRHLLREGLANPGRPPRYRAWSMRLEARIERSRPSIARFCGDSVLLLFTPASSASCDQLQLKLPLQVSSYQTPFVEAWRSGELEAGEITIAMRRGRVSVYVPFRVKGWSPPSPPPVAKKVLGIDENFRSLDVVILGEGGPPRWWRSTLPERVSSIQCAMGHKWASICSTASMLLKAGRRVQAARLYRKYKGRQTRRVNHLLHVLAKAVVHLALEEGVELVAMENLTGIRSSKWSKERETRTVRRRGNQWPFRRLQLLIEYKCLCAGIPVVYVDPRDTSSLCPRCGARGRAGKDRVFRCACGFRGDKDYVGAYNIAQRCGGKGPCPSVPAEGRQMHPSHPAPLPAPLPAGAWGVEVAGWGGGAAGSRVTPHPPDTERHGSEKRRLPSHAAYPPAERTPQEGMYPMPAS